MDNNNISFKIDTIELLDYSLSGKDKEIPHEAVFNFDINTTGLLQFRTLRFSLKV